jgi:hypothetical protein
MPQITKNQHFVPKSLLKHFTVGADELVNVYDSKRNILRPPTTINRVLSENYFYDRDNVVENFLAEHVEGPASRIIEGIANNPTHSLDYNRIDLLRFISVQLNRTPSALATALECIDKFTGTIFQRLGELNRFDEEATKGVKLVMKDPKALLARQTVEGALNWPFLEDLQWHVLINKTNKPFVISDHPVVHYNWYLRESNELGYTSLTSCGLQIFLPISKSVTMCLYDSKVYKVGVKRLPHSEVENKSDIRILNELQFRNRDSFIVFPLTSQALYIQQQCHKIPASSLHQNHAWSSSPTQSGTDEMKSTHAVWITQVRMKEWLSVSKIKRRIRKQAVECHDRKPEVVEAHKLFIENARARCALTTPCKG